MWLRIDGTNETTNDLLVFSDFGDFAVIFRGAFLGAGKLIV